MTAPLVDTRGEFKVGSFDGKDEHWVHWSLKFEAFTSLLGWEDAMSTAAMHGTEVSLQGVEQLVTETARALFSLLVAKCEGKAFGIVQLCPKGNGLEAWRRLKDEYEGRSGNRLAAMLRGILNPRERWNKDSDVNKEFLESLNDWEILIGEYRAASGENVSDRVLVATILEHAPARYQDILRAIPAQQKENYPALRRWIKDYCVSSRIYGESGIAGGPGPMDVGQIKGDKSGNGKKGKGKDGKSNGKHVKGKAKSEKGSGNEKSSTHRLQRSFRATVGSARNGDINVLIVGTDSGGARIIVNTFREVCDSVTEFEFCKRCCCEGCCIYVFRGTAEG